MSFEETTETVIFKRYVTSEGFTPPTMDECYDEVVRVAGEVIVDGEQKIKIKEYSNDWAVAKWQAAKMYAMYQELNNINNNLDPDTATGSALDNIAALKSLSRIQARKSTVEMTLTPKTGNTANTYAKGSLVVATESELKFKNSEEFTLQANSGDVDVLFEAVGVGANYNVPAESITNIDTDVAGKIGSVINLSGATLGRDSETDQELRARILDTYPSVLSATRLEQVLTAIDGVNYARIINNYHDEDAVHGVPFGSSAIVLDDGRSANDLLPDTAKDIWDAVRYNSVTNENWFSPAGAIQVTGEDNGFEISYPIIKPVDTQLAFRLSIDNGNTAGANLQNRALNIINDFLGGYKTGERVTAVGMLQKLYSVPEVNGASAVELKIRLATDTTDWDSQDFYFINMQYNEIPKIISENLTIVYNGSDL